MNADSYSRCHTQLRSTTRDLASAIRAFSDVLLSMATGRFQSRASPAARTALRLSALRRIGMTV